MIRKNGATSVITRIKIKDSTTGLPKTGLAFNTSGLIIAAIADTEAATTAYTAAGSTIETITTLGTFATPTATKCRFKEVDSTNHPGVYEIQLDNARWAVSNATAVIISVSGTGILAVDKEADLVAYNPSDAVRLGLTALPNAAAEAAGGLYTRGTGAGQINQPANGVIDSNTKTWNGLTTVALPLAPTVAGRTLDVSAGGEAGIDWANIGSPTTANDLSGTSTKALEPLTAGRKLDVTAANKVNGVVLVDTLTTYTGNTPQTGDAYARLGVPAGASVSADIAAAKTVIDAIKTKVDYLPAITAGSAGGLFIAGANAATSITTALTANIVGNITGNLSGSAGSVTGNVGGSVASIATGGITSGSFAASAITNAAIANSAIGASKLATDTISAIKISTDAIEKIRDGILSDGTRFAGANIDAAISSAVLTDADIAGAVWNAATGDYTTPDTFGGETNDIMLDIIEVKSVTDKLNDTLEDDGGIYRFTANALEEAPSGGGSLTAEDVWTYGTRILTAGTNISLAKGTGVTGFNDLSEAQLNARTLLSASYATETNVTAVGNAVAALPSASAIATAVQTGVMTESYGAEGDPVTMAQALYMIMQELSEFAIVGDTITVKKLDKTTTAATYTLDDPDSPTSRTRAT